MSWLKIVATLFEILGGTDGFLAAALAFLLEKLKPYLGTNGYVPAGEGVAAAPAKFKQDVKQYLMSLVNGIDRPLVRRLLARVVGLLTDQILDTLYDRLFGSGVSVMAAAPDDLTAAAREELAECQ